MSEADCLKLTGLFGERDRARGRLLADALLDLYAERRVRQSLVLRGAEGFGRGAQLRSDRLLTLSEDLPVVTVAIDRRERIEGLVPRVLELQERGLVTLERARLLEGPIGEVTLPESPHEATKLTVYVGRGRRAAGRPVHVAVCELLAHHGVLGATALLGVDGTSRGARTRARFFARNAEVPMAILAVGPEARVAQILPQLDALLGGLVATVERVRVCKRDGQRLAPPHSPTVPDERGLGRWQKLTVVAPQAATVLGRPLHQEILRRLRSAGIAGATGLRGVWGFHGDHPPHGDRVLQVRRHVPVMTVAIDTAERIARAFEIIDELTARQGLVTSELIPAMRVLADEHSAGGLELASPLR